MTRNQKRSPVAKKTTQPTNKNIVHKTKPCFHSDLSHAHNVLGKKCLCGHGNCVEMHVYMQINHVGKEKEKQMFWISQNTLSRSLSTRVWMFRKKCFWKTSETTSFHCPDRFSACHAWKTITMMLVKAPPCVKKTAPDTRKKHSPQPKKSN